MNSRTALEKIFPWRYYDFYLRFFTLIFCYRNFSVENLCFLNQCLNGGTCMEVMGSHSCLCMEGFSGSVCESELLFHDVVCSETSLYCFYTTFSVSNNICISVSQLWLVSIWFLISNLFNYHLFNIYSTIQILLSTAHGNFSETLIKC